VKARVLFGLHTYTSSRVYVGVATDLRLSRYPDYREADAGSDLSYRVLTVLTRGAERVRVVVEQFLGAQ